MVSTGLVISFKVTQCWEMTISFTRRFKVKDKYSKITANIVKAKIKAFMKERRLKNKTGSIRRA